MLHNSITCPQIVTVGHWQVSEPACAVCVRLSGLRCAASYSSYRADHEQTLAVRCIVTSLMRHPLDDRFWCYAVPRLDCVDLDLHIRGCWPNKLRPAFANVRMANTQPWKVARRDETSSNLKSRFMRSSEAIQTPSQARAGTICTRHHALWKPGYGPPNGCEWRQSQWDTVSQRMAAWTHRTFTLSSVADHWTE